MNLVEFCRHKAGEWTWTPEYAAVLGAAVRLAEEVAMVVGGDPGEMFRSYTWAQEMAESWARYMADGVPPRELLRELAEAARELSYDITDILPPGYWAGEEDRQYGIWEEEEEEEVKEV